jgi:hypothetical protein
MNDLTALDRQPFSSSAPSVMSASDVTTRAPLNGFLRTVPFRFGSCGTVALQYLSREQLRVLTVHCGRAGFSLPTGSRAVVAQ